MHAGGSDPLPLRCFRLRDQRFIVRGHLRWPVHRPSYARCVLRWHRHSYHVGQPFGCEDVFVRGRTPTELCISVTWSTTSKYARAFTRGSDLPRNAGNTMQLARCYGSILTQEKERGNESWPCIPWLQPRGFVAQICNGHIHPFARQCASAPHPAQPPTSRQLSYPRCRYHSATFCSLGYRTSPHIHVRLALYGSLDPTRSGVHMRA
jgi:hypothetical protein